MKIIIHTSLDTDSSYGLSYFLNKYGVSLNGKTKKSIIQLVPQIHNEQINYKNQIKGWIDFENRKVPIFESPSDLTHMGDSILIYSDNDTKYPCVVASSDGIIIGIDIFKHICYSLSGKLENVWINIGTKKDNVVNIPFADSYCRILFDSICHVHKKLNTPLVHKAFWPYGKKFAVCLTHDVDEIKKTYQWITHPMKLARKYDLRGIYHQVLSFLDMMKGREPYWTFEKIMKIENDFDVKSSFFFLNENGEVKMFDKKTWRHMGRRYDFNDPKVSAMIKELHSKGWDVGLHGSFYSYKDYKKIQEEKKALENVLDDNVCGIRQHNLNLNIPETWLHQEKTGLEYDTTLGFNDCIGFRWGTCFPFRPFHAQENRFLKILEIPLIIEDLPFFRNKNSSIEDLKIIETVEEYGGVMTLLWHHSVFNSLEYPGWSTAYEKIIGICKKKNAWITSAKEISDWWRWRENTNFEWDYEGAVLRIAPNPKKSNHFLNIFLPDNMMIHKISNADIIENDGDLLVIKTNSLNEEECVEIEFSESNHGS